MPAHTVKTLPNVIVGPQALSLAPCRCKSLAVLLFLVLQGTGSVYAQTLPNAGALRQQIERENRRALPREVQPSQPAEPAPLKPTQGVTITVRSFRFAGNTLLSAEELEPAVQPYVGRALGFAQLQEAAQAVAKAYRDAGWIVRSYLPRQDVTAGVITIQVVEAVFSGVQLEGEPPTRFKMSSVLSRIDAQQKIGDPLNAEALDRGLLLADDLPGVSIAGALRSGQKEGESELVLRAVDEPLVIGEVGGDNWGSRSTGEERATVTANLNSPLGIGDLLTADVILSWGMDYYRLAYTVPVGNDGWRVGVNGSQLAYELRAPEFKGLNGRGDSDSLGVTGTYPLLRTPQRNLYLALTYDRNSFHNEALNTVQSDYHVDNWTVGLAGNLFDNLGGGGSNAMSLAWTTGRVDQGRADIGEDPDVAGDFNVVRYSASRQQVVTPTISLFAALSGQYTRDDLDSSERFYLGGPTGVRAYPVNEGSGSRGELINLEMRWRLPESVVLSGFYDWGHVHNFAGTAPSYELKGYGVGLAWTAPFGLKVNAALAHRQGDNPNPTATGRDQDGSLDRFRLWLNAVVPF